MTGPVTRGDHRRSAPSGATALAERPSRHDAPASSRRPRPRVGDLVERVVHRTSTVRPVTGLVVLAALVVGLGTLVWVAGGTSRATTHLFYVPILLGALLFRLRGATLVAVAASIATSPAMPMDVETGATQPPVMWLMRTAMFLVVGALAGTVVELRDRSFDQRLAADLMETLERPSVARTPVERALVPAVRQVLDERPFHTEFQPIYDLADGHLVAVEALTRFDCAPARTPDRWFAAAHAAGLGVELEIAAIEVALAAAADLPEGVGLGVNASPATVADARLLAAVRRFDRRPLTVEITEHAVIEDYPVLREALAALVCLGVDLAVDDAGAGFASLQHIVQLEPDVIKLDMSLAQDVAGSPLRRALATSLIEFTERSGARLVVEGIETLADLTAWASLGAHAVQGYAVGRPARLPVARSCELLDTMIRSGHAARA
ncbi:EAL domain-containing protein [Cellulomonas carbonis]|nr:EAL domain-containing protein [Cellulomonas carbonis]